MLLHSFQQRARDIPLWRDQVSELSIKVMKDGRYQRFHLVARVAQLLSPFAERQYQSQSSKTSRFQQENRSISSRFSKERTPSDIGFAARLDSSAFKLKEDLVCRLNLTFEYGADEPYKLVFTPLDESFPPVRATWRKTEEVVITDAPIARIS
jgi:hypothetical protein